MLNIYLLLLTVKLLVFSSFSHSSFVGIKLNLMHRNPLVSSETAIATAFKKLHNATLKNPLTVLEAVWPTLHKKWRTQESSWLMQFIWAFLGIKLAQMICSGLSRLFHLKSTPLKVCGFFFFFIYSEKIPFFRKWSSCVESFHVICTSSKYVTANLVKNKLKMIKGAKERLQRNQISKYFVCQKSVFGYIMIKQNSKTNKK